jgi:hypothetical protein
MRNFLRRWELKHIIVADAINFKDGHLSSIGYESAQCCGGTIDYPAKAVLGHTATSVAT